MSGGASEQTGEITAAIIGGSGYTGGELLRLLLGHPRVRVSAITSRSMLGEPVHRAHPNLRGTSELSFSDAAAVDRADVVFLCLPHGQAAGQIDRWLERSRLVVDLSADFRLRDATQYREWYEWDHPCPARLDSAVYGLPELSRSQMRGARLISGVGCNATAMNLALFPLARAGLISRVICDIKVGSSEGGVEASAGSHHPERSGAVRSYAPVGHRHAAEVVQSLGTMTLDVAITAIEMVRGVLCTAHVIPTRAVSVKELWPLYRRAYQDEPFVRLVAERSGLHRLPDPKILAGTNWADVGFDVDPRTGRIVALCAIDNLMKGAAGSAVQAMNIALGLDERAGLGFAGLHPV